MEFLRTPDERFENLPGYPFVPNYVEVGDGMRMHYVDEGPRDGQLVLMLHGEPTWSYLYRKMIPIITEAGYRAVAPDLIGFGRSDKPTQREDYTYARHLEWVGRFLDAVGLQDINLVCQDWGGLIGLRLVAAQPERFSRVVTANTILPTGQTPNEAFIKWRDFCLSVPDLEVGRLIQRTCTTELSPEEVAAYDAPFPDASYKAGARIFPALVPFGDNPEVEPNKQAWASLSRFEKPFLTAFSDKDPIMAGLDRIFQKKVPGAQGQPHTTIEGGSHFLQEDCGEALAHVVTGFIAVS
ncbi:MAG: haloalkane dehalogenase [Acidobacteriota bacterium]|nr:haloalkane dehalogenase [Acidobacteriota bacterium]